ncbi:MAG: NUDIX domain-containing protein [Bacilli bacterium]|nr:NUDIX domain-containing protein [Bacilli bacterium]
MHREVIIYIINNKKEILLQKRSSTKKHHPNKWALCSGHVEDFDEDFEAAAVRELNEELGLIISKEELELVFIKELVDDSKDKHITKYYVLHTDKNENDFVLQKEELSEVKWYEITKVIDMMENKSQDIVFSDSMLTILKSINKDI